MYRVSIVRNSTFVVLGGGGYNIISSEIFNSNFGVSIKRNKEMEHIKKNVNFIKWQEMSEKHWVINSNSTAEA